GLRGVPDFITSDAHEGIKSAVTCVFPGVKWQRCQFHLQQNAQYEKTAPQLSSWMLENIPEGLTH
ncbi:MAG: transposase, partial [Akkermansia sp.]